jgi:metallo-beta-lactamase family protein
MKITFLGAAGQVTGSAYHVSSAGGRVLVDFGLFQGDEGSEELNRRMPDLAVERLDAVVLTHGHLDHTGRLPLLTRSGYQKPIYATQATIDMSTLIITDAAHIQASDIERLNRKRARAGEPALQPLYTPQDAALLKPLARAVGYDQPVEVAPGVVVCWREAGHMLGSASLEMTVREGPDSKVIVFSGDLGPRGAPLLRDAAPFSRADVVILESTYGDRDHRSLAETLVEGQRILEAAVQRKSKILVPAFAIGRTQAVLYYLAGAFRRGLVPPIPVYLDSPMAIEATKIYQEHSDLFDAEARQLMASGQLSRDLHMVRTCPTADDSRALNDVQGPCVIIAGAGMCNAGRILHHLRHNLHDERTTVIIAGYQANGSLGRQLVDGAKTVRIFGEPIKVQASIHTLGGLSAHAGQSDLVRWFDVVASSRPRLVLTHGDDGPRRALAGVIESRHGLRALCPQLGEVLDV